jgi:exopolyphosphatase / guanosine-5'-triphosphate,3'-diphosphate pyrophosphatase
MTRVAAVDCGTNTLRLLIADLDVVTGVGRDVARRSEIVRLGQGVDRTGAFAPEALDRTFAVLDSYARLIADAGVRSLRFAATSAARDVSNLDDFAAGVRLRLGVAAEVISGDDEARLSYDGATRGLASAAGLPRPWAVLDIGGGSTELVFRAGDAGPVQGQSLDVGSVRLTERHLHSDPPTAVQIAAAEDDISTALDAVRLDLGEIGTLVGVAGSVTTIAALVLGLPAYQADRVHLAWLDRDGVEAITAELLAMTVAQRRTLPVMEPGRADVIGAGAMVLRAVLRRLGVAGLVASEHDILDGLAWSLV